MKKLTTILIICLLLLSTMPVSVMAAIVEPPTIVDTLKAGETERDSITVNLPTTPPKADVIFVFDATGSMGSQIAAMKSKAGAIMGDIDGSVDDVQFGVGSIVDYPHYYPDTLDPSYPNAYYGNSGDYAWLTDQDLTSSTAAVQTAINGLYAGGGADGPQDYTRALYESKESFSWRDDAKKFVVIFGDNWPHSYPSGASLGWNTYGADPGRDEDMTTPSDNLDFVPVVNSLRASNIIVIAGDCSGGYATPFYQYIATQTLGARFDATSASADDMADAIVDAIEGSTSAPIETLTVTVREPEYASWVTVTPPSYSDVPWGDSRSFAVTITPPADTKICGEVTIHLDVYGDGVLLGTTTVTKTIIGDACTPSPEFPTLALPVAMILGFAFIAYSIRSRKED